MANAYVICDLCARVATALKPATRSGTATSHDETGGVVRLGSWSELQDHSSCATCSKVIKMFDADFEARLERDPSDVFLQEDDYEFCLRTGNSIGIDLSLRSGKIEGMCFISLLILNDGPQERRGLLMDPHNIPLDLVITWMKTCDVRHGECICQRRSNLGLGSVGPTMLIDLVDHCLVDANGTEDYIALSYVWGDLEDQFATTRSNISKLKAKGNLTMPDVYMQLPGTIRRALQFSALVGARFLWVDRLCIVQDDATQFEDQVNRMGSVYSNAYLTICAGDGDDAESGLKGLGGTFLPRNIDQVIFEFRSKHDVVGLVHVHVHDDESAVYSTRAWTFQEEILAERSLFFRDDGLTWQWKTISMQEKSTIEWQRDENDIDLLLEDMKWPCIEKWNALLNSYLCRQLRFDVDILRAFSGIIERLGASLGAFHFEMPEQFFDVALLWHANRSLTRRKVKTIENVSFPSWSRLGWQGRTLSQVYTFGLCHERRSDDFSRERSRERTIRPCVVWYKTNLKTSEKVVIPNDYAVFRSCDSNTQLPRGWSLHENATKEESFYVYDRAPSDCTFWHPLPEINPPKMNPSITWSHVLYSRVWRSFLQLGERMPPYMRYVWPHELTLNDGCYAGFLFPDMQPQLGSDQIEYCELVAISAGYASIDVKNDTWIQEMYRVLPLLDSDTYHFYNVMWIKRDGNITERRGVGRVLRDVWDKLPKEEIELYLH